MGVIQHPYAPATALADLDSLTPEQLADQVREAFMLGYASKA
jgi:hypothetical protein